MPQYVFIDESGDLGQGGSRYLVLAALIVPEPKRLVRIIRDLRWHKFRKELRKASEIKANRSSRELIRQMLIRLNQVPGARVSYAVLEKRRVFSPYLKADRHRLYDYVAGKLARNLPVGSEGLTVLLDRSKEKQLQREEFDRCFRRNLKAAKGTPVSIEHAYSHAWVGLQFADALAWACFQKFERNNPEYVELLGIEQEVYHVW